MERLVQPGAVRQGGLRAHLRGCQEGPARRQGDAGQPRRVRRRGDPRLPRLAGEMGIGDGKFLARGGNTDNVKTCTLVVADKVRTKDVSVGIDARNVGQSGILLRYKDLDNFLWPLTCRTWKCRSSSTSESAAVGGGSPRPRADPGLRARAASGRESSRAPGNLHRLGRSQGRRPPSIRCGN